ncbi:putative helicase MOV-10 [Belonocnema kinseyi]|uniref:putative helicase MOV-10 n=1 Tax=Belonocnema kinseyi TaxID=2817044 RepID=UPI00143CF7EA|nr:putative helicase MOV-10 [Belonocnema kinseyi]
MFNDIVEVQALTSPTKYNLVITKVDLNLNIVNVKAPSGFMNIYQEGAEYIVKFKCSNWPIRVCHYAISLLDESKLSPLLNPTLREVCKQPIPVLSWFNKNIERNAEQMQAIQRILGQTACPSPYLVFGPPGTGKTAAIVEAISQISKILKKKVLVCTPSNAAADEITKRLLPNIEEELICRLNSQSRDSYIFIDEAGQATQPQILIPLGLTRLYEDVKCPQLVLSGDPKQLGPVVKTKIGQHLLGESMLERIFNISKLYQKDKDGKYNSNILTKLVKNYRNHETILRVPNQLFYDNELESCGGKEIFRAESWSKLPKKKFPIIFHAIHGIEKKLEGSTSAYNQLEAEIVVNYVIELLGKKISDHEIEETDIGIVSPFKSQGGIIKKALEKKGWNKISVGTVEIFQGQERDIIIVSTVRSVLFQNDGKFHIGFLSHEKRFNVTITRAKSLLIVVGNPKVLQISACWRKFIEYCLENEACLGEKFTLSDLSQDEKLKMMENKAGESLTLEVFFKRLNLGKAD